MYIYTFIYAARFLYIHMVLHVFWKLEFLTLRDLGSHCGIQRLINISELDTLLERAHYCKKKKKKEKGMKSAFFSSLHLHHNIYHNVKPELLFLTH